jgi:hypothetical protein
MIKCNYCEIEKEQTHFRRFKKDPLCLDCFHEENRKKRKSLNPKDSCIVCGVSKDSSNFVKGKNCCKSCKKKYMSEYYENNKESWIEYLKKSSNSENFKEKQKEYVDKNKDKVKEYQKEYRIKNKENLKQKRKKYNKIRALRHKERYENDIDYRIRKIHRNILKSFLRRVKMGPKKDHTSKLLGYSYSEFRTHIESLFLDGMNWFNHGEWHIDHIRPISSFDLDTDPSIVNALDNLQPLWAIDNMKKSNKYVF